MAAAERVSAEKFLAEKKKTDGEMKGGIDPNRTWSQ